MPRNNKLPVKVDQNKNTSIQIYNKPSLINIVKEGFAFGVGSSVARNVIDNVIQGIPRIETPKTEKYNNCINYNKCLKEDDKYECFSKINIEEYNKCKEN
jgi:hypothetical protein